MVLSSISQLLPSQSESSPIAAKYPQTMRHSHRHAAVSRFKKTTQPWLRRSWISGWGNVPIQYMHNKTWKCEGTLWVKLLSPYQLERVPFVSHIIIRLTHANIWEPMGKPCSYMPYVLLLVLRTRNNTHVATKCDIFGFILWWYLYSTTSVN